jgi:heme exporter protein A
MHLRASDIAIERGGRRVIFGLSFELGAGEALVLTGPNGAGKTTLIRAIAGFLPLAEGTIQLDGGAPDAEVVEQCHLVGHRDGIKAALTVAENARFFARYLGGAPSRSKEKQESDTAGAAPTVRALGRLGLAALADVPAAYLSAGQRRRLGLSRLLLAERPLWLLDEPTVSLDADAVATLASMIGDHLDRGGLAVAATHIPLGLKRARELRLGRTAG